MPFVVNYSFFVFSCQLTNTPNFLNLWDVLKQHNFVDTQNSNLSLLIVHELSLYS